MYRAREIEENFEALKDLFTDMSSAIKYHKQKEITLERDNKILNDAFKSLKESTSTITNLNVKYRDMFVTLNQLMDKIMLLEVELEEVKKENLQLKASSGSGQHLDSPGGNSSLLQKKIIDLEKQLSESLTYSKGAHNFQHDDKQLSKLKDQLLLENKLLKEQLTNFRNLHYQTVSEYQLNNVINTDSGSQQNTNTSVSHMHVDPFNQDELQPLHVDVINSDVEDDL